MGPSISEGSTVAPIVLSLAIPNNLVLTMSSQIGTTLATRRMQNLETLHYYVLHTLFPLQGYLDDHHGEFLKSGMVFVEFPDLIEYYTTMENCTLFKDIKNSCTLANHISWRTLPTKSYKC